MDEPDALSEESSSKKAPSQTVCFALDGVDYEIDLDGGRASGLRRLLETYIRAGRRAPGVFIFAPRKHAPNDGIR
ncbi:Lsr2 dimerization domain-containing protein [Amycolatopsis thailandensis]|uniref:Lsr2 dimerization domain-containing protein n=1 Tax=Amycolatopsis thailandensis TaxID=589330 RepID=UPI00363AC03D